MSESVHPTDTDPYQTAEAYIQTARELYREHATSASYQGRRTEDQGVIAELANEQAVEYVDLGARAIAGLAGTPDADLEDARLGKVPYAEFRKEFARLLSGFAVLSDRLKREGFIDTSYFDHNEDEQRVIAAQLFNDFQDANTLRFGVKGSGIHRANGQDKDVAYDPRILARNANERRYTSGVATHVAGKMSTDEWRSLRRQFPEPDTDEFVAETDSRRDARHFYEEEYNG